MTAKEFRRVRRWDKRVHKSYQAGVMDGFDMRLAGHDRPDPLLSDYNTKFYFRPRMKHAQTVTNAAIARSRGKADGWDSADREVLRAEHEEIVAGALADGFAELEWYANNRGQAA